VAVVLRCTSQFCSTRRTVTGLCDVCDVTATTTWLMMLMIMMMMMMMETGCCRDRDRDSRSVDELTDRFIHSFTD